MTLRLVVVDDHPIVRLGLKNVLQLDADLDVVADVGSAEEALQHVDDSIDLVLTDLRMAGLDGLALTRLVKASHPDVAVLLLSSFDESLFAEQALDAGASGFVMKDAAPEEIHDAARRAVAGGVALSAAMWARLLPSDGLPLEGLSDDERALLQALAGAPTSDLGLMRRTGRPLREIDGVRRALLRKLGLRTPVELLLLAHRS